MRLQCRIAPLTKCANRKSGIPDFCLAQPRGISYRIEERKQIEGSCMTTIFSRIIHGEIPCHRLAEDDRFLAFLDVRPIARGHALVIPKVEIDHFFEMGNELLSEIMVFARPVAQALERGVPCRKVGLMVAGLEVPHAHLHLVPIQEVTDLNFANAAAADPAELANLAELIRQKLGTR